jgi:hypothetical protein
MFIHRRGPDDARNWVTTLMLRNSGKSDLTVEEPGWTLFELPLERAWEGLITWFVRYLEQDQPHHDKWDTSIVAAVVVSES